MWLRFCTGPDGIQIDVFKQLGDVLMSDLIVAYNSSWKKGIIPEKWTDSYIGPVPKPHKDHRQLKGYRIITCQNVMGKIPEKVVARRITAFIEPLLPLAWVVTDLAERPGSMPLHSRWKPGWALKTRKTRLLLL
jgi:hypothetical protein